MRESAARWIGSRAGGAMRPSMADRAPPPRCRRRAELTLERIFASPSLSGPTPRAVKLSPDGRTATLLKPRPDDRDRYDLWAVDVATGAQRMLVDSTKVGTGAALSETERMNRERQRIASVKGIASYDWAPDSTALLVPIDGDLWLAKARRQRSAS